MSLDVCPVIHERTDFLQNLSKLYTQNGRAEASSVQGAPQIFSTTVQNMMEFTKLKAMWPQ